MKNFRRIKKGLAVMLCVSMVQGMTPLPVNAEGFTDGFTDGFDVDSGNTDGGTGGFISGENSTGTASASQDITTGEENGNIVSPSQDLTTGDTDEDVTSSLPDQDKGQTDPDGDFVSQDPAAAVQEQINALPDTDKITEENLEEVTAQLDAIDEAKIALTEEQTASLDFTRYDQAAAAVMVLMGMESANEPALLASSNKTVYDKMKVVYYIGENGSEDYSNAEVVTSWTGDAAKNTTVKWDSSDSSSTTGRYYVITGDVTIDGLIEITGTAHLILEDGATLNARRGIKVSTGNQLYICAQSQGTGKLTAGAAYGSAIGGTQYGDSYGTDTNQPGSGNIYICGGNVTASTTAEGAAAIGGAKGGSGGSVTICGGNVTATSRYGDGIGGGASFSTDYNGRKGSATIDASSITGAEIHPVGTVLFI